MASTEELQSTWIKITVGGMTAGVVVAAVTYAAAEHSTNALATVTGAGVNIAGTMIGLGADMVVGKTLGTTIRIVSSAAAETTKHTMITSGRLGSAAVAATAGAVTALTITLGSRMLQYTIEYGGQLSREAAVKLSEMYLKYKSFQSGFVDSGNITDLASDQWVVVGDPTLIDDDTVVGGNSGDSGSIGGTSDPATGSTAVSEHTIDDDDHEQEEGGR
jgi:hypothetical protein